MTDINFTAPLLFVYVSCADDNEIMTFHLHRKSRALVHVGSTKVAGSENPSQFSIPFAPSPNRRFLYAALRAAPFPLASFSIDPTNGILSSLGSVSVGRSFAYLSTDRDGRWLLGAAPADATIAVYAIDRDGAVRGPAAHSLAAEKMVHSVRVDPVNRFAYACALSANRILQYSFDDSNGTLASVEQAAPIPLAGSGPRHLTFHPKGPFLYVINETGATIDVYHRDAQSGALHSCASASVRPEGASGSPLAADIHVSPDGRFVYGSERGSSTISAFRANVLNGQLERLGSFATERAPRGFAIDPTGELLAAAGTETNRLALFSIDRTSGRMERIVVLPTGRNPNWVEIVEPPR